MTLTSVSGLPSVQTLERKSTRLESGAQAGLETLSSVSVTSLASPPDRGMTQRRFPFFSGSRLLDRKRSCFPSGDHLG